MYHVYIINHPCQKSFKTISRISYLVFPGLPIINCPIFIYNEAASYLYLYFFLFLFSLHITSLCCCYFFFFFFQLIYSICLCPNWMRSLPAFFSFTFFFFFSFIFIFSFLRLSLYLDSSTPCERLFFFFFLSARLKMVGWTGTALMLCFACYLLYLFFHPYHSPQCPLG